MKARGLFQLASVRETNSAWLVMEHIAWPLAALIFGTICIFAFRKQLIACFERVSKVGKDGVTMTSPEKSIQQQADASSQAKEVHELLKNLDSPALLREERAIISDLERRNLDSTSETVKLLVRHLVFAK